MSPEAAYIAGEIFARLRDHCRSHPIAWALPDGAGYAFDSRRAAQLRKPDASVVLKARVPEGMLPPGPFALAPDLAVEVVSPSDNFETVESKILDYLEMGTSIMWLARPKTRRIVVYRPNGTEVSFGPEDWLDADPVLPGLRFLVADVFPAKRPASR